MDESAYRMGIDPHFAALERVRLYKYNSLHDVELQSQQTLNNARLGRTHRADTALSRSSASSGASSLAPQRSSGLSTASAPHSPDLSAAHRSARSRRLHSDDDGDSLRPVTPTRRDRYYSSERKLSRVDSGRVSSKKLETTPAPTPAASKPKKRGKDRTGSKKVTQPTTAAENEEVAEQGSKASGAKRGKSHSLGLRRLFLRLRVMSSSNSREMGASATSVDARGRNVTAADNARVGDSETVASSVSVCA